MEEDCFGKRDSSSSSLLLASRLSHLAQPFTMNRQISAPQSLDSLTPPPSNDLHSFDDLMLPNSFPNLNDFGDEQLLTRVEAPASASSFPESSLSASACPFDGRTPREFADGPAFSQLSLGFCGETGLDGFTFENKSSPGHRMVGNGKGVSSSVVIASPRGNLVKHDSKMNPLKISAATDSSSLPIFQNQISLQELFLKSLGHESKKPTDAEAVGSKVADLSFKSSSKNVDDEEEDLDSPCWKGFQYPRKSPSSKPLRNEPEAAPSLNPQAPIFYPSNGTRATNFSQNNATGEASSSFGATYYQALMHESSKIRSATEQIENTSSSGAGSVDDFGQILQSISRCRNINASMAVKAVHYMSDLLVRKCDYDHLKGNELEMIHDAIDNLYLFINSKARQKTPMLALPQTGHSDYLGKNATHERPNTEMQIARSRDLVVRDDLDSYRNGNVVKSYSLALTRGMQDPDSLYRDAVSYADGKVNPALTTALKEKGRENDDFQPRALLNLWMEAQAALCSMKYENNILRMKLGSVPSNR